MNALLLNDIINNIKSDSEYLTSRRTLHENYEWLEAYWRGRFINSRNPFEDFISEKGQFYWRLVNIKALAIKLATIECVGSSNNEDYAKTIPIARATSYLRNHSNIFKDEIITCDMIDCRIHKVCNNLCSVENGLLWSNVRNCPIASFKALMYIFRQVRNNLFHGHKLSLDQPQSDRDKDLVSIAASLSQELLNNLVDSEIT